LYGSDDEENEKWPDGECVGGGMKTFFDPIAHRYFINGRPVNQIQGG
jgi:hypothetical protein